MFFYGIFEIFRIKIAFFLVKGNLVVFCCFFWYRRKERELLLIVWEIRWIIIIFLGEFFVLKFFSFRLFVFRVFWVYRFFVFFFKLRVFRRVAYRVLMNFLRLIYIVMRIGICYLFFWEVIVYMLLFYFIKIVY